MAALIPEHTFPKSLATPDLGTELARADAHNLRAVDAQRNNSRSNKLFGASTSNTASYSIDANSWYPSDEWIGDAARIIMYMYVRYPSQCAPINVATGNATFSQDMPDILLQWNAQDPPSTFEINRNNVIASNQGNRNPFIDNPYLATKIWSGPQATDTWGVLSNETHFLSSLTLYPTQTTGILYVSIATSTNTQYTIFNTQGQLLQQNKLAEKIDISTYAKGMYFVHIKTEQSSKTFKILKN